MAERDTLGRFVVGHKPLGGAPGRPSRAVEASRLADFNRVVTGKRWRKIVEKVVGMAEGGDIQAIKLLFSYALGNPLQRVQTEVVETAEIREEFQEALSRGYPEEEADDSD